MIVKFQYTMEVLYHQNLIKEISDWCKSSDQCAATAENANQIRGRINRAFLCYSKYFMGDSSCSS